MGDVSQLSLVKSNCGSMCLVYEGRTCKLKNTKGCTMWTNMEVTAMISEKDHIESCLVDQHLAYEMEKKTI
ncbi:hypothetical protein T11_5598 [Trichinella zimbabwensis]|uniref:FLYWCH-type domain-containing protein n=1 Tax=Trichinella zimbabwensis TaxID=268475 RepID=A0A0V1H087_9BILA|nr:hypothetical protein T11_5598 [Trichinella zimbabwensis]